MTKLRPVIKVEETPGWLTEIDVFEIGGKAKGFEHKYNMNVHVFRMSTKKEHGSVGGVCVAPWRRADDDHVYGLERDEHEIKYFVDGVVVRTVENTHWHQPLFLIFDSETMPKWFGMPDDEDLPSTFSIEYAPALIETEMVTSNPNARPELIPVGRFGTVDETSGVAVMLARNGYITGQTINVNGGWYMT